MNTDDTQNKLIDFIDNRLTRMEECNTREHQEIKEIKEKEHLNLGRKIDRSIEAATATAIQGRRELAEVVKDFDTKFESISSRITKTEIQNASFYGKVAIISGLFAIAATIFVSEIWQRLMQWWKH